jgi:pimeloyl-ACP methyl ester carboxylesterase
MKQRMVDAPAGRVNLVEAGDGPLVLLVHGFPETWYSWRHQLHALAAGGYRAVAIDVRGYGRSSKPADPRRYRLLDHASDNVAVVRALGERTAAIVGHDWGSPIAVTSALLRPDVFTAIGLLSVPYTPRGPVPPTAAFAGMEGDEEFYVSYFQQPGRAEAEIEPDVRGWLVGFYATLSAHGPAESTKPWFTVPHGGRLRDRFTSDQSLEWLTGEDLAHYAAEFERSGFTGALNRYRCMDQDWIDLAAFDGAVIAQPSVFIIGEQDASRVWLANAIEQHATTLPGLVSQHVLPGVGHWIQQEAASQTSEILLSWLDQVNASGRSS